MTMNTDMGSDVPALSHTMSAPASPSPEPATPAQDSPTTPESSANQQTTQNADTGVATTAPAATSVDWHSQENPYLYAANQLAQRMAQYEQQEQQRALQMQHQQLIQQGVDPRQAAAAVELRQQQMANQRQQEELNRAARPLAAQKLAQQIEQAYGVKIDANELMTTSTGVEIGDVQQMLVRADALVTERRKGAFQKRQESGADKTPRSEQAVTSFDTASLKGRSPAQILGLGLRRMNGE